MSKKFGGLRVIEKLSFEVGRGERVGLIGPNGAGKSTVFNLISGVYPVDSGRIAFDGVELTGPASARRVRHGIARTFQNIRLMPHLSALENVMFGQHCRAKAGAAWCSRSGCCRTTHGATKPRRPWTGSA